MIPRRTLNRVRLWSRGAMSIAALAIAFGASSVYAVVNKCGQEGEIVDTDSAFPSGQEIAAPQPVATDLLAAAKKRASQEKRRPKQSAQRASQQAEKCRRLALRKEWAEQQAKNASPAKSRKAQEKARQAAQLYELSCQP